VSSLVRPIVLALALLGSSSADGLAVEKTEKTKMTSDSLTRTLDQASRLEGSLTIVRAHDGGARAVAIELRNTSPDQDVVLRVNTEMSAFIMQTVSDGEGRVLSTPANKFRSSEVQHHQMVRIARGSLHRWEVPIGAQLPAANIPEQGLDGRLVINVALDFSAATADQHPADSTFRTSILTLHKMQVRFTRAACASAPLPGQRH
jgi:hypothetical protein